MSVDFTAPGYRRRSGTRSLIIAAIAIAIAMATLLPYLMIAQDAPDLAKSIATYAFIVGFVTVAPLLHVVGFVLGIAALVRSGDSKLRGVLGLILNSAAVLVVVGLIWLGLSALAAYT
jgi:ABC-type glycerol-3-phosphate transport system permease component